MFWDRYRQEVQASKLLSLSKDLAVFIRAAEAKFGSFRKTQDLNERIAAVLACDFPRKAFDTRVAKPMLMFNEDITGLESLAQTMVARKEEIITKTAGKSMESLWTLNPPLTPKSWNTDHTAKFLSLVAEWRDSQHLGTQLRNLFASFKPFGKTHATAFGPWFLDYIEYMSVRQLRREDWRQAVERERWSLSRVSQGLASLIDQQKLDLDLCLFLDALDEYDGPTEFIVDFLQDLVRPRPDSRTKLKILFSSRPWKVFDAFDTCPGFQIHQYTGNDIRELCAQSIKLSTPGYREIQQLADSIVQRASGVFLWVKLVLSDLCSHAEHCLRAGRAGNLRQELLDKLDSLPRDLADYYNAIIERIPSSFRWETYCLLECLCKSAETISVDMAFDLLKCSSIGSYSQLRQESLLMNPSGAVFDAQVREMTGGLVEAVKSNAMELSLQFLHQTMLEFVKQPQFPYIILGPITHITEQNGYSFLAKYYLYQSIRSLHSL